MRAIPMLAVLFALACGPVLAQPVKAAAQGSRGVDIRASCSVSSDFEFHLSERSVIYLRASGSPRRVLIRDGGLFIDDAWVRVGAADRARLRAYEHEVRGAMPLARQIGSDAAQIAFTAIGEVAAGLSGNPEKTRAALAAARGRVDARLAQAITANRFSGDMLGEGIGDVVAEVLPVVVGDVVGGVLGAVFGGDAGRLERLGNLEAEIEALIAPRARALERSAEALCKRMRALDAIENALEYRLPDGRPLALLDVGADDAGR